MAHHTLWRDVMSEKVLRCLDLAVLVEGRPEAALFVTAAWTGLRLKELADVRFGDVDLDRGHMVITPR